MKRPLFPSETAQVQQPNRTGTDLARPTRRKRHAGGFEITREQFFLVFLQGQQDGESRLFVAQNFDLHENHGQVHRLTSPIFLVKRLDGPQLIPNPSAAHFIFTCSPTAAFSCLADLLILPGLAVYLTHGNAEIVCIQDASTPVQRVRSLEREGEIAVETWELNQATVVRRYPVTNPALESKEPLDFNHVRSLVPADAGYLLREFHNLMVRRRDGAALTMRRDRPSASDYLKRLEVTLQETSHPQNKYNQLWSFTGAHTHSVSQRFTGLTPLAVSTCPIGGFELLGLGKALRAIRQFGIFIFRRLAECRLPERIERFVESGGPPIPIQISITSDLGTEASQRLSHEVLQLRNRAKLDLLAPGIADSLAANGQTAGAPQEQNDKDLYKEPLVHYFSALHGFQFEGVGISLPLQTISSANTFQWNLMSLTHEYCHVITGAFLAGANQHLLAQDFANYNRLINELYAECGKSPQVARTMTAQNRLDFFCKALLYSQVQSVSREKALADATHNCARELRPQNEVITLVFDLIYFFRGQVAEHLQLYWAHWLSLPGVWTDEEKLIKYIARSCCAMAVSFLENPGQSTESLFTIHLIEGVERILSGSSPSLADYGVEKVISLMNTAEVKRQVDLIFRRFLPLICATKALLVCQEAREHLWSGAQEGAAANLTAWARSLRVEYSLLEKTYNPLQLLSLKNFGAHTDEGSSLWLLTILDTMSYV